MLHTCNRMGNSWSVFQ